MVDIIVTNIIDLQKLLKSKIKDIFIIIKSKYNFWENNKNKRRTNQIKISVFKKYGNLYSYSKM